MNPTKADASSAGKGEHQQQRYGGWQEQDAFSEMRHDPFSMHAGCRCLLAATNDPRRVSRETALSPVRLPLGH